MSGNVPRVALFADTFHEINGAALTLRHLAAYAAGNSLPMLCVHSGIESENARHEQIEYLKLAGSPFSVPVDHGLSFDPLFLRHYRSVLRKLKAFRPDVIHITGVNDVSILGVIAGRRLNVPVVASWHTNLHQFARSRIESSRLPLPRGVRSAIAKRVEAAILRGSLLYHKIPRMVLVPNDELASLLRNATGREVRTIARGVDTKRFSPIKRTVDDGLFRFGYVGRLRPEKGLDALIDLERDLLDSGRSGFGFLIVGDGSERRRLECEMTTATFTGYLEGDELAVAYANIDVLVFPSRTDTYGNVVHEANASGVPVIVSSEGGPKFLITENENGFVADGRDDRFRHAVRLLDDHDLLFNMRVAARNTVESKSWSAVFADVYSAYRDCLAGETTGGHKGRDTKHADHEALPTDPIGVTRALLRSPIRNILLRWNWKSALLSASIRSPVFLAAYLQQKHGLTMAFGAMGVQFGLRTALGGINGGIVQSYSRVEPAWHVLLTVPLLLATISHVFEFAVQTAYDSATGSRAGGRAVLFSMTMSVASAVFNLFTMRRGVLIVGDERQRPLWRDLIKMPWIAAELVAFPFLWIRQRTRRDEAISPST